MSHQQFGVGPLQGTACVTSIMVMAPGLPPEAIPSAIERDRVQMAARPGMELKLLPVLPDFNTSEILTGGVYLFDTIGNAQAFHNWCRDEFMVEGVPFEQMPGLTSRTSKVWELIGAEHLHDLAEHQVVMRVEEWRCPAGMDRQSLQGEWGNIREQAKQAGLSAVWLLYNSELKEFCIVTTLDRISVPEHSSLPDMERVEALAATTSLAQIYVEQGAESIYDRSSFILTVWFPVTGSDSDRTPLWPNSPPLPGPDYIIRS